MGAREKLRSCFPALPEGASNDLIERAVDEILADHAHELAEKQRDLVRIWPNGLHASAQRTGVLMAANLIDPRMTETGY